MGKLEINKKILDMDYKPIVMNNTYKGKVLSNKNNIMCTEPRQRVGLWRSNEEKEEYKRKVLERQLP